MAEIVIRRTPVDTNLGIEVIVVIMGGTGGVSGRWWPHRMSLEVFLPLQVSEKSFRRIGISSSLNV